MILNMYSIMDNKAAIYNCPFFLRTDAEAVRALTGMANDPDTRIGQFPDDFTIYKVGEFDDQTGQLGLLSSPTLIHVASALVHPDRRKEQLEPTPMEQHINGEETRP